MSITYISRTGEHTLHVTADKGEYYVQRLLAMHGVSAVYWSHK